MTLSKSLCRYCGYIKEVKKWAETGEDVCLECRLSLLHQKHMEEIEKLGREFSVDVITFEPMAVKKEEAMKGLI